MYFFLYFFLLVNLFAMCLSRPMHTSTQIYTTCGALEIYVYFSVLYNLGLICPVHTVWDQS